VFITKWFLSTILSVFFYGLWGLFSKLASLNNISVKTILLCEFIGSLGSTLLIIYKYNDTTQQANLLGIIYAILVGISGTLATFYFFIAISNGPVAVVVPLSSTYPIITMLLISIFLQEPITIKNCISLLLIIVAVLLCN
jgi:bacterial/archaeal transporter family protein